MNFYVLKIASVQEVCSNILFIIIILDPTLFNITQNDTNYQYFDARLGAYNAQRCGNYTFNFSPLVRDQYVPLLKQIEEDYDCSGVCKQADKFIFSNINDGIPKQSCLEPLKNHVLENIKIYLIVFAVITGQILIANFIMSVMCIVKCKRRCCPKKKNNKKKYPKGSKKGKRIADTDDSIEMEDKIKGPRYGQLI
eukprot:403372312